METSLLLVDDDAVLQATLLPVLRRQGYQVARASTLHEARLHMQQQPPTLLLLDLSLPDGNGFSLLNHVQPEGERPLIIVITGSDTLETVVEALRRGAFDYLTKPVNYELLLATVQRAVSYRQFQRAAQELERMRAYNEGVRVMASTAAHNVSQFLTIIMGETQMLQEDVSDPAVLQVLERIVNAADQAADTLVKLRQMHREAPGLVPTMVE
ncbi:MAG: response regulator [Chloroflexaceae bacterium]|jgi:DNA-binding NtrC family response regulator|nr:response regulator [Chloroflexaceae bacterium]